MVAKQAALRSGVELAGLEPATSWVSTIDDQGAARLRLDRKQLPVAGDALEFVHTAIFELETRSGDQISHRRGSKHLPGLRVPRCNARTRMHGDTGDLAVNELALAGV